MKHKYITEESLDDLERLSALHVNEGLSGSVLIFNGVVRKDGAVKHIIYEAYGEMVEKEMDKIKREAMRRFELNDVVLLHRVGTVAVGESSLYIAVYSPHRKSGLGAMDFIIDEIKEKVPIWKKEVFDDDTHKWR